VLGRIGGATNLKPGRSFRFDRDPPVSSPLLLLGTGGSRRVPSRRYRSLIEERKQQPASGWPGGRPQAEAGVPARLIGYRGERAIPRDIERPAPRRLLASVGFG
jgi:hypothetical protein